MVQVLAYGMECYLSIDDEGNFDITGGEFKIRLHLRMLNNAWEVYKTDEATVQK